MDSADVAQADLERAIERFEKSRADQVGLPSQLQCVYCDGEIPAPRRKHLPGVETCVGCQTLIEKGVAL